MTDNRAIESLWYELGTAADAATAANMHRSEADKISADGVREIWKHAVAEGRLPPFMRPANGFPAGPSSILKRFMMIGMGSDFNLANKGVLECV